MLGVFLAPMRLVPGSVHSHLLSLVTNHFLLGQTLKKRLAELEGKVVSLTAKDLAVEWRLRIHDGALWAADAKECPDVMIRGDSEAFLSLAMRRADPDTLFFQRRLSVEGETETGVHIKNLIDGFDYDLQGHFDAVLPAALAATLGRLGRAAVRGGYLPPIPGRPRQ